MLAQGLKQVLEPLELGLAQLEEDITRLQPLARRRPAVSHALDGHAAAVALGDRDVSRGERFDDESIDRRTDRDVALCRGIEIPAEEFCREQGNAVAERFENSLRIIDDDRFGDMQRSDRSHAASSRER